MSFTFMDTVICSTTLHFGIPKSQNCPVVMTANGTLRRLESRQRIKWLWDRLLAGHVPQQVDHCITVSSADTAIHRAAGISAEKITQIPNGLDLNEFESLPPRGRFRTHLLWTIDPSLHIWDEYHLEKGSMY